MLKKILPFFLLCALVAHSAVNYPYPQRKNYGNSTINAVNSTADNDLKVAFQNYLTNFYVEGTCNGTACARIKFYDPDKTSDADYTVSEGIGYSMLMLVYFSDASTGTNYQSRFDKLWAYYNAFKNNNGVMHWKVRGFSSVDQQNGATDGEIDVALALSMAYYQFGDSKYQTAAKNLIDIIWSKEMESDGLHRPGDAWNTDRNPSYVSPAAFEIFKSMGSSSTNWTTALSRNYTFLKNNQNSSSGLPSDWAQDNGTPKQCTACGYNGTNYGQDAVRSPWRWAMAALL